MTVIGVIEKNESTALEQYLVLKKNKFAKSSGTELGDLEVANLKTDLERLSNRINSFLSDSSEVRDSHLILGKVQSGKTAHMLGVVAGLVNSPCSLVVLVSGVTGQLTRQTQKRLTEDIGGLPKRPIHVLEVPTAGDLSKVNSTFIKDLMEKVDRRIRSTAGNKKGVANLPVLAMLENVHRVEALRQIIDSLFSKYGQKLNIVIIDDEADQASPNALASQGDESTIYGLLKVIRESGVRNCLLSYTATPQAVLLASRTGALKPRHCSVLSVGQQYFGIKSVTSDRFANRLIELSDVPSPNQVNAPDSLRSAFLDFLIIGCIRRLAPDHFFGCDEEINRVGHNSFPQSLSVQMLIHPSGRQKDHAKYHQWIKKIKDEIEESLGARVDDPDPQFINDELQPAYERVLKRSLAYNTVFPALIPTDWIMEITNILVGSTGLVVVNSDSNKPTDGVYMPDNDSDWERNDQWVLIGGDILGRGVTMPNLVSTYFLRAPKSTNYDTLSQQMRFCGYRSRYQDFVYVYAPKPIISRFKEAEIIDRVLFNYASNWDKKNIDLSRNPPEVVFAQRGRSSLAPTRPNVLDRNIIDTQLRDFVFIPERILYPEILQTNSNIVKRFRDGHVKAFSTGTNWEVYLQVSDSDIEKIFDWQCNGSRDLSQKAAALIAFDKELEEAGLGDLPRVVAIRNGDLFSKILASDSAGTFFSEEMMSNVAYRSLLASSRRMLTSNGALGEWKNMFNRSTDSVPNWILNGEIGYEGDPQRRLRDKEITPQLGNCVIFAIEPVYVYSAPKPDGGEVIGLGVQLAIMAPKDFALITWKARE
jgi:hypothetical protein